MGMAKLFKTAALAAALLSLLCCGDALAQARPASRAGAAAAAGVPLRIKGLSKVGKACLVASPDFEGKVKGPGRNSGRGKRWAALEVEYVTAPEWLDEAAFTFHVMSIDPYEKNVIHYYTCSVTYVDIAKGEHGACVMLPPSAVARYGEPIAFGVEIEVDGKQVAVDSEGQGKGKPWWTMLDTLKGSKVMRHSGILQDRSKTPFGLTHIDEYEAVR